MLTTRFFAAKNIKTIIITKQQTSMLQISISSSYYEAEKK